MKTAVEWLVEQWPILETQLPTWLIEQAKEMEKQQIMDATYYGHLKGWVDDGVENSYGEQYYNETFKSEEDETDGQND
jgi:hypothetical protein